MTTLFDVMLAVARVVTEVVDGTATGGSTATLIDTGRLHPDDYWNQGRVWMISGNNASMSRLATDYVNASGTWTTAAFPLANAAGNQYAVSGAAYPKEALAGAVNLALMEMGKVTMEDLTSLTGVTNQLEYSLPAGVSNLRRVMTGTAPDYYVNQHWDEVNGKLRFGKAFTPQQGEEILLFYAGKHPSVNADGDVVNELLPMERVVWGAALYALRQRQAVVGNRDASLAGKIAEATQRVEMLKAQYPTKVMNRDPKLAGW
jgi:hypothetical protein